MRVAVFGSTGKTGRLLVEGALARGHDVTAFARAPHRLGSLQHHVRVVRGDALDPLPIGLAVDGQDAVLLTLGAPAKKGAPQVAATAARHVCRAMQTHGVGRLVALSALATGAAQRGRGGGFAKLLGRGGGPDLDDLRRMEVEVRRSGLRFTLVRVGRLSDGTPRGAVRSELGHDVAGDTRISRADVAAFMLDELERETNVGHAVALAT